MAHRRSLARSPRSHLLLTTFASALVLANSACTSDSNPIDGGTGDTGTVTDGGPNADAMTFPDASMDASTHPDATADAGPTDTGPTGPRAIIFLHTNDEHSHELGFGPEIDDYPVTAPASDTDIVGGVKRRAKVIQQLRDEAQIDRTPLALVGAGDLMMGSLFHLGDAAGPQVPAVDYAIATVLNYDVLTLGNHEFDFGVGTLATALSTGGISPTGMPGTMRIPIVVSNIRFSNTSATDDALAALYSATGAAGHPLRRTHVQTFGSGRSGVKVGFFGLMGLDAALVAPFKQPVHFSLPESAATCSVDSDCPNSICLPPASNPTSANGHCAASTNEADPLVVMPALIGDAVAAVQELRAQNVDLVVAVTHVGVNEAELSSLAMMGMGPENAVYSEEIVLAKQVDAALTNAGVPGINIIVGGHSHTALQTPLRIPNTRSGITTYIVQAGSYGRFVGKLKMTQASGNDPWVLDDSYSKLVAVTATVSPTGLPAFTDIVLNTAIDGLIDGLEDNVISRANDGLIYPGEQCDGNFLPNGGNCAGLVPGATAGTLVCTANRQLDMSGCTITGANCGNAALDGSEQCDGANLNNATCVSLGYDGGNLGCAANCTYDFSACTPFFPSLLEAALNFASPGSPIRNDPNTRGDLFFRTIGSTSFDIAQDVPFHESNLINLVTDSARYTLNTASPPSEADPVRMAINAAGLIRDPIKRGMTGAISFSDLFRVMPLGVSPLEGTPGYPLVDFYLNAVETKSALEIGVNQGLVADSFWLGVSGARISYDPSLPAFDPANPLTTGRITKVELTSLKQNPWDDTSYEPTPLFDTALGAGLAAYPDPTRLVHSATSFYVMLFAEALGVCPRDAMGNQRGECASCMQDIECTATNTHCDMAQHRCRGGDPVAFHIRSFAPINDFGLYQEVKEFLALMYYVKNFPGKGTGIVPANYSSPVPRRFCCVGPACTPDRVCN